MVGLYDKDWNLIDVFDNDEDALVHAVSNGIGQFKIQAL